MCCFLQIHREFFGGVSTGDGDEKKRSKNTHTSGLWLLTQPWAGKASCTSLSPEFYASVLSCFHQQSCLLRPLLHPSSASPSRPWISLRFTHTHTRVSSVSPLSPSPSVWNHNANTNCHFMHRCTFKVTTAATEKTKALWVNASTLRRMV